MRQVASPTPAARRAAVTRFTLCATRRFAMLCWQAGGGLFDATEHVAMTLRMGRGTTDVAVEGALGGVVLICGLLVAGCGTSSAAAVRALSTATAAAPTATVAPETTLSPDATPSPETIDGMAGCPASIAAPQQMVAVGALMVASPHRALDYPSELLPSDAPQAPYRVATSEAAGNFQPNPPVNPSLSSGYSVLVCNETNAPHTLTSLTVTISSFTPSSGSVHTWHVCDGGAYNAATKQTTTGCGGGFGATLGLVATLPKDSAGASAAAVAKAGSTDLPVIIKPREAILMMVAVNGLTSQGTYALSFGVRVDEATPSSLSPDDGSFLIAPSAVIWTGTACETPAMQAQIPAASQDTYYVCPPAS